MNNQTQYRWVQQGSALHDDAARRQTTLYIPEGHVTMFPAELAEQVSHT
jgi:exoribonuclease R